MVARWPGSSHDSMIFNHSLCRAKFEEGAYWRYNLLGDSGYGQSTYMLVPIDTPASRGERLYNESQIRTRNCIERAFGVWKRRFPILAVGMRLHVLKVIPIIMACAVLHNILRGRNEPMPPDDPDIRLPVPWAALLQNGNIPPGPRAHNEPPAAGRNLRPGYLARQNLVSTYFDSL